MVNSKLSHAMNNFRLQLKTGMTRGRNPRTLSELELTSLYARLTDLEFQHQTQVDLKCFKSTVVEGKQEILQDSAGNKKELLQDSAANKKEVLEAIRSLQASSSSSGEKPPSKETEKPPIKESQQPPIEEIEKQTTAMESHTESEDQESEEVESEEEESEEESDKEYVLLCENRDERGGANYMIKK